MTNNQRFEWITHIDYVISSVRDITIRPPDDEDSEKKKEDNTNKFNGKFEIQYELIDGLKVTSRLGYTYADVFNKSFTPLRFYGVGHNQTTANADLTPIFSTDPETGEVTQLYHNSVTESKNNYWQATYEIFF